MFHPRMRTLLLPIALLALLLGCAERESVTESEIQVHGAEWVQSASVDFHGHFAVEKGPESCTGCHGADWTGRNRANSCFDCHLAPITHTESFMAPNSELFHGKAVEATGVDRCTLCHGEDHRGGDSGGSCYTCHGNGPSGHPGRLDVPEGEQDWITPTSPVFHGLRVAAEGDLDCMRCHGADLRGGTSGVSCALCHGYRTP